MVASRQVASWSPVVASRSPAVASGRQVASQGSELSDWRTQRLADSPAASAVHMPVPGVAAMEVDEEAHSTTSSVAS